MATKKHRKMRAVEVDETLQEALQDPEVAASYVRTALADRHRDDGRLLKRALLDIARARGISTLARGSESRRRLIYKALSDSGNPSLATLESVLADLGLQLEVRPAKKAV